ncbi:hypothetical protein TanjilG_09020 [Lupinus angustifolius]|uniref:C2H2-type domain-containing protein n=1 Tax=Lupinus angustifolius TaxID=3871 RepID=A0A4P1QPN8_LUPAN|nr:PREDICTED: uncharacterized protein LOC109334525 isoform X1 [Lupinus angustifolius]OIV91608.1 hypothetical protein TanjilG_09020 [Lupinus angustifolius]
MFEFCLSLKRRLQCKPHPKQVHDPKQSNNNAQRTKSGKFEGSNIKDFIKASKKQIEKLGSFKAKPKGGIEITSPITHEIFLDSEVKICPCCPCPQTNKGLEGSHRRTRSYTPSRIVHNVDYNEGNMSKDYYDGPSILTCDKCGEKLKNHVAVEAHHISEHSVSELQEDSSRQIVETICGKTSTNSENMSGEIDCILKVQNKAKTLECFEEYREMVKNMAEKLQKKHPRCVADGNELLRFYGTTIACSLGRNSSYSLCTLEYCGICQILRQGFSPNKEFQGALGVYTTSTCGKAFDSIMLCDVRPFLRKSVIVCRVIAGRVSSSSLEETQEKVDSLSEKISGHSDIEELYVLNPNALLPCFVLIFKQQTMAVKRFNSSLRKRF